MNRLYKLLFLMLVLHIGCVEEFDPSSQGYENLLVIEAFLSNDDENFVVKLARSTPIDTTQIIPEKRASVSLVSQSGEEYELNETYAGTYESDGPINPMVGMDYQLRVHTSNNKTYESSMVTMRDTPPIQDSYFRYEEIPTAGLKGVQFYVDTQDPNNDTWFYRWEWEESWVFRVQYDAVLEYVEGEIVLRKEKVYECWKSGESTSVEIASSKNLSQDIISEYPIQYVSSASDRLKVRYGFNVKQYSLSEASYNYWDELKKATESLGTLFDPQPSIVKGNYYNIEDENEIVLGYFDASEVQEKRVYVVSSNLPGVRFPNYYAQCWDSLVSINLVPAMDADGWELIEEIETETGAIMYSFSTPHCVDCRLSGTNEKPDFWEY